MTDRTLPSRTRAETQADRMQRHCIYMIATGRWGAGDRLPSIRETRQTWGVNQVTVEEAYGRLVEMGLVESRPRSGYYVAGGRALERTGRHRDELEDLHRRVAEIVGEHSDLSVLGVLRYLTRLEEMERARSPEIAFVECSTSQTLAHAQEISERLRVPVLPLTTEQVSAGREEVPSHVRRLLTSGFHLEELRPLHRPPELTVMAVPIEVSSETLEDIADQREVVLLEREESMASHIAEDLGRLLGKGRVRTLLTEEPPRELERLLGDTRPTEGPVVLLSPRLWGNLDASWREDHRVREASFRVPEDAWAGIADAVGLPFPVP